MKGIKITAMMLLISQAIVAQTKTAEEIAEKRVDKMEQTITLTPEQRVSISSIVTESSAKMIEHKKEGTVDPEFKRTLRKEERVKIKEVLTEEQRLTLKETRHARAQSNKGQKALRMEQKAKRAELKNALRAKRDAFNSSLTSEEQAAIERARAIKPEHVKGKEAKAALTEEEKTNRKAAHKEMHKLLKPVIKNHQIELDAIKAEQPENPKKINGRKGNGFYYKFLLMQ